MCLYGTYRESEILYPGEFNDLGIQIVTALTEPSASWNGFHGQVTDFLKDLPSNWAWHTTDFYLCGISAMVADVRKILIGGHGVPEDSIFQEAFTPSHLQIDRFNSNAA